MTNLRFDDPQLLALLGGDRIMSESSLIDRLVKERVEKNTAETLQQAILQFLRGRFGSVPRDIAKAVKRVSDAERLNALVALAGKYSDLDAFRAELAS